MATFRKPFDAPIPRSPEGRHMLCFGSVEWHRDLGGAMVRNINDALQLRHWQYQSFLNHETRRWEEVPGPVQAAIDLQQPVKDGDRVRASFFVLPTAEPKQSVRIALKPGVRWIAADDRILAGVTFDPPELFFAAGTRQLPAIRILAR